MIGLKSNHITSRAAAVSHRAALAPSRPHTRRSGVVVRADLDPQAALALTQLAVAYAGVVGGEAAITGLTAPATQAGKPTIVSTLAGVGGTVAGAVVASQGNLAGAAVCGVVAAYMMTVYVDRVKTTPYDPKDWPGAKAWPAVMGLITFFEIAAAFQSLLVGLK